MFNSVSISKAQYVLTIQGTPYLIKVVGNNLAEYVDRRGVVQQTEFIPFPGGGLVGWGNRELPVDSTPTGVYRRGNMAYRIFNAPNGAKGVEWALPTNWPLRPTWVPTQFIQKEGTLISDVETVAYWGWVDKAKDKEVIKLI